MDWPASHPHTHPQLRTLHDAVEAFRRAFGNVNHDRAVEHAISLMMEAAKSGDNADRKAATDQIALVLRLKALT